MSEVLSCEMKREISSNWHLDRLHSTAADLYLVKMNSRRIANLLAQILCQVSAKEVWLQGFVYLGLYFIVAKLCLCSVFG